MVNVIKLKEHIDNNKYDLKVTFNLNELKSSIESINKTFNIEELKKYTINNIETNIFTEKQIPELDILQNKINVFRNY
jgi:ribosomal protein S15P/S13E